MAALFKFLCCLVLYVFPTLQVVSPSLLQDEPFHSYVTASINKQVGMCWFMLLVIQYQAGTVLSATAVTVKRQILTNFTDYSHKIQGRRNVLSFKQSSWLRFISHLGHFNLFAPKAVSCLGAIQMYLEPCINCLPSPQIWCEPGSPPGEDSPLCEEHVSVICVLSPCSGAYVRMYISCMQPSLPYILCCVNYQSTLLRSRVTE